MIIARIHGGLGNQLFQYALGRNLALKNNTELKLDISFYKTQEKRKYLLNNFNIVENFLGDKEDNNLKAIKRKYSPSWFLNKITKKIIYLKEDPQKYFQFDQRTLNTLSNMTIYLDGYWQNEKYFLDAKDHLLKELSFRNIPVPKYFDILKKIEETNSISMHFRRGDYVNEKGYYTPLLDYYHNALDKIIQTTGNKNLRLFIFSDDIDWVKKEFKTEYPMTYVDADNNLSDYEQLIAMSKCKHNIIANSSFSWWGAWLNTNKDKLVICPPEWTEPGKYNTDSLFPNSWIRL
jgi:hypothetical protein